MEQERVTNGPEIVPAPVSLGDDIAKLRDDLRGIQKRLERINQRQGDSNATGWGSYHIRS